MEVNFHSRFHFHDRITVNRPTMWPVGRTGTGNKAETTNVFPSKNVQLMNAGNTPRGTWLILLSKHVFGLHCAVLGVVLGILRPRLVVLDVEGRHRPARVMKATPKEGVYHAVLSMRFAVRPGPDAVKSQVESCCCSRLSVTRWDVVLLQVSCVRMHTRVRRQVQLQASAFRSQDKLILSIFVGESYPGLERPPDVEWLRRKTLIRKNNRKPRERRSLGGARRSPGRSAFCWRP